MPIPVACQCGAKFAAKDELAGKAVKCPKCAQPLKIPAAGAAATPAAKTATAPTTPTAKADPAAASTAQASVLAKAPAKTVAIASAHDDSLWDEIGLKGSKTGLQCPQCNADMQPGAVLCIACGFNTQSGKKLATKADSDAKKRREEIERQQREAAEKAEKIRLAKEKLKGPEKRTASGELAGLPYINTDGEFGSIWASVKMLLFNPSVLADMPPTGGTAIAALFPVKIVAGVVMFLSLIAVPVFLRYSRRHEVDMSAIGPALGAMAVLVAFVLVMTLITTPLIGLSISAVAHPLLKYAAKSNAEFWATFRCIMYTMGACYAFSLLPVVGGISGILWFILLAYAFSAHHRVPLGMGFLASIVGILAGYVLLAVVSFVLMLPVIAIIMAMAQGQVPAQ